MIIEYLTDHPASKSAEIAEYVDLKPSRVRDYLSELIAEEIVVAEGGNRNSSAIPSTAATVTAATPRSNGNERRERGHSGHPVNAP